MQHNGRELSNRLYDHRTDMAGRDTRPNKANVASAAELARLVPQVGREVQDRQARAAAIEAANASTASAFDGTPAAPDAANRVRCELAGSWHPADVGQPSRARASIAYRCVAMARVDLTTLGVMPRRG